MTTYVLHGGMTSKDSLDNDLFFRQFTSLVNKASVKVMMCYWARDRKQWEELLRRDQKKIQLHSAKTVHLSIAEDPKDLFHRIAKYDVLYVAGGDAERIEPLYPELSRLKHYLENKVYIGSSMGAFLASASYVLSLDTQDETSVHSGVGLLPVKILCHWDKETRKQMKLDLLRKKDPESPIVPLDECKFVTMYT